MKHIIIRDGFFFKAGIIYRWTDGYHVYGVGINMIDLKKNKELKVTVSGKDYLLDCKEALEFIKINNSQKKAWGGTWLGVISRSLLKEIK